MLPINLQKVIGSIKEQGKDISWPTNVSGGEHGSVHC